MTDKVYTLDHLRMTPEADKAYDEARARLKAAGKKAPKVGGSKPFVKYPVAAILRLGGAKYIGTVKLYPLLLHMSWKSGLGQFKLTNVAAATIKLQRRGKSVALRELEQLGLIAVERRPRRSPLITIVRKNL